MPLQSFRTRIPCLIPGAAACPPSSDQPQLCSVDEPPIGTWHMIASSSSMWQDQKRCIKIVYSPSAAKGNAVEFGEETTWLASNSTKQTITKGTSRPSTSNGWSQCVYDWRGAGWLRFVTTRWEIVGFGAMGPQPWTDGEKHAHGKSQAPVILVTFVPKTTFSPHALSILIKDTEFDHIEVEAVVKNVSEVLKLMGLEMICDEVDKFKLIPRE